MPLVSVVVPVFNSGPELDECLQSIAEQSLADVEVICVDDGSTDDSAAIIARWADRDPRFRLIAQDNAGGGAARNTGMAEAQGDFLAFLDADDVFAPELLEASVRRLEATGADFSLHDGRPFDGASPDAESTERGVYLRRHLLPDNDPFSPHDVADRALQLTSPAPWLRVYRRAFVEREGLRFRPRGVANDVGFTAEATLVATSITVVDRVLVHYRKGHGTTQSSTYHSDPLAIVASIRDLRDRVVARGALPEFERSFRVQCFNMLAHALRTTAEPQSYELLHGTVQNELLAEFDLTDLPPRYFGIKWLDEAYTIVTTTSPTASPLHPRRRGKAPSFVARAWRAARRRLGTSA